MGDLENMQNALNTIQKSNAEIAKDLETISANQKKLAEKLGQAAAAGGAAKQELQQLTKQAEDIAKSITETEQKADSASGGSKPGQPLPGQPGHGSGQPVPPPGQGGGTLPAQPPHASGQPVPGGVHPSGQPVPPPGQGGGTLPAPPPHGSGQPVPTPPGGKPDAGLPPTPEPKGKK